MAQGYLYSLQVQFLGSIYITIVSRFLYDLFAMTPNALLFQTLVLLLSFIKSRSCQHLSNYSLSALHEAIDLKISSITINPNNPRAIFKLNFCATKDDTPFRIIGTGCDAGSYEFDGKFDMGLHISCSDNIHKCEINCPGTHFTVLDGASLVLNNLYLRGSEHSAIIVGKGSSLNVYSSKFQGWAFINCYTNTVLDNPIISHIFKYSSFSNENDGGNGGAISAGINSVVVSKSNYKIRLFI